LPLIVKALFKSLIGDFDNRRLVSSFEKKFASFLDSHQAISMPYARIGVFYILKALELPPGSEVLLTPITIVDIVNIIHLAGLKPVFIDIEDKTFNVKISEIKKKLTNKSKVLLLTHLFGITPDMDKIVKVANKHNLIIIEDFSQSLSCKFKGKFLGTFGTVGIYSLSWIKTLTTFYGGMIITDNQNLAKKIRGYQHNFSYPKRRFLSKLIFKSLILSIITQNYIFSFFTCYILKLLKKIAPGIIKSAMGSNENPLLLKTLPEEWLYKYTSLQAMVGIEVLRTLKENDEKRIDNVKTLFKNLSSISKSHFPEEIRNAFNVYWRLPFVMENITEIQDFLFQKYIDNCNTNLYVCSDLKVFSKFKNKTPIASTFKENMTFIPIHSTLNKTDMVYIADAINDYFKES